MTKSDPNMTATSNNTIYSCECLVNSKIPYSLFAKLQIRLKTYFNEHFTTTDSNHINFESDEVLAATIDSLQIIEERTYDEQDKNGDADQDDDNIEIEIDNYSIGSNVEYAECTDGIVGGNSGYLNTKQEAQNEELNFQIYLFKYPEEPLNPQRTLNLESSDTSDSNYATSFYTIESFPNPSNSGLWESLHFDSTIKASLLSYISAIFKFTLVGLGRCNDISFNRIVLIHGPPGTGKSTLAKALVSKLSTRLYSLQHLPHSQSNTTPKYEKILCFTIHTNQLFSRWFSESGKSIQKLFEVIREKATEGEGNFVCVIIDEIESLAMDRKTSAGSTGGGEPTDSIRAVNTLLTQIDLSRSFPNILYLTTSNFPTLLDSAFLDRIDWSFEIPLPSERIIYSMLVNGIDALKQAGIIGKVCSNDDEELVSTAQHAQLLKRSSLSGLLLTISKSLSTQGQSGRAIKRLPLMVYSAFLQKYSNTTVHTNVMMMSTSQFLKILQEFI